MSSRTRNMSSSHESTQGQLRFRSGRIAIATGWLLPVLVLLGLASPARAGKLSWLDDVVREVIAETRAGGKSLVRTGEAVRGPNFGGGAALPLARRRGRAGAVREAVRRPGACRPSHRAPLGGFAPGPVLTTPGPRPPGGPVVRGARARREAAGGGDGRGRAAARRTLSRRGRDDGAEAWVPKGFPPSGFLATTWPR